MPTLTPQQLIGIARARDTPDWIAFKARAGCGKTFLLQQVAQALRRSGISISFNKSTAGELGKKMPSKFPAQTLHAICLSVIKSSGKFSGTIKKSKLYDITRLVGEEANAEYTLIAPVMKLVSLAKTFGIIPTAFARPGLAPDDPETWESLSDQYDIPFSPEILSLAHKVLTRSIEASLKDGDNDFDDLLYISLLWPHRFPRYPVVIGDEVQDWSELQHHMAERLLLPGGRLIVAGDDRQAIYAFRGALADSYSALVSRFSMQEMPLTVSFRCPRAIIYEARRYVPDIEPAESAIDGQVIYADELDLADIPKTILCRNNAPLVGLALRLLVSGRTAEVAGQDVGKGLISLTKRITKRNLKSTEFLDRLQKWADREISRKPRSKPRVQDKVAALTALADHHKNLESIQKHLEKLYPNPADRSYRPAEFHLSTIHKAKGREWPDVLFLDPQLLPSKYAVQEWEQTQEANLAYVGVTRAQQTLTYCASENIRG